MVLLLLSLHNVTEYVNHWWFIPSRHDCKIVDWDVKNQNKQNLIGGLSILILTLNHYDMTSCDKIFSFFQKISKKEKNQERLMNSLCRNVLSD